MVARVVQGLVIVLMDIEVVEMLEQIVFNNLLPNSLLLSQTIIPDSAIKKVHTVPTVSQVDATSFYTKNTKNMPC